MATLKQPQARVIYVADSAGKLSDQVQKLVCQADNLTYSSGDIYDTLGLLSCGLKPSAIIIAIETVDWNELDFFNLAQRLSPETHIYVTGNEYQREKSHSLS